MLDHVILGMLALRPISGYDLGKWMRGPGRFIGYRVQLPQIYRTLAKLADQGWVEFQVEPRDGKPDAKVYRLTDTGKQALLDWAHSPYEPAPRPMDPDFTLRFLIAGQLDRDLALSILRTELDYRREQQRTPTQIKELTAAIDPIPELDPAWATQVITLAHEHGRQAALQHIDWLESTITNLENQAPPPD
ncbi:PadR family transcriptional regulator [Saccharopolyspora elongata]|uniref:PadR family transcriptional regulator n=1 Tax=Saccharopolyspora elongata TaxID=2530387 RepID=UPI00140510DF|nr:PadR family transcriptional regulator [Saccharopolyspora elongata]